MSERVVSIKLVADATGLTQSFNRASDAAQNLKNKASGAGQSLADSARNNREAWATVGTGLTAVGVAVTGIGVAALKTGVQYNTLQQTTRAALTTLLGSAAAANAQMDKLDAFARNSPFAKQTFISAQQQMLAFGVETKKVIPYLDAVQNAVAAAGGSNAEIEGIVATMSKIQSSSKITAQDLNEFGNRGVNAAELIGSQMGKTGAQIRADITSGSLDATEALDALAAGMSQKFDGAADNVKNTFAGAMDRVKAAWRDFAAELAKPLVDPNGGGALVDLLNWTADMMRGFQGLPEPIKETITNLTGVVGVGSLLGGMFMLTLPKVLELKDALHTLGVTGADVKGSLKAMVPAGLAVALAVAAAALIDVVDDMREARVNSDELARSLVRTGDVSAQLERGFSSSNPFSTLGLEAVVADNNLRGLNTGIGKLQAKFEESWAGKALSVSMLGFGRNLGQAQGQIKELDAALAELVAGGSTDAAAQGFEQFAEQARAAGWSQDEITAALPMYEAAQQSAAEATAASANKLEELQGVADATADAVVDLADEILNFGKANIDSERAALKFEEQLAALNARVGEGTSGLDRATEAGQKNYESLLDMAEATSRSAAATYEATGNQELVNATLQRGRDALIAAAIQYGMTEDQARAYADQLLATPETVTSRIRLDGVSEAELALNNLVRTRIASIQVRATMTDLNGSGSGGGRPGLAGGGTVGYAGGGTIARAASGTTIGGIGGGVSGGTVYGRGTAKSDSILTRLSKGEEVVQEPYASANRSLLKSINRGDFHQGMIQPQIVVMDRGGEGGSPLIGGNLQFVSSGNMHSDVGTVTHELRKLSRGGKYVGSR